jgi:hypothetical protein
MCVEDDDRGTSAGPLTGHENAVHTLGRYKIRARRTGRRAFPSANRLSPVGRADEACFTGWQMRPLGRKIASPPSLAEFGRVGNRAPVSVMEGGSVVDQLRVEAPDERAALALVDALRGQHAEIHPGGGEAECEVVVELDGNPERAIVDALNAVDRWLVQLGVRETTVSLDGHSYTLSAPHPE